MDSADVTASAATVQLTASTITDVDALTITTATQTTGNALTINAGASIPTGSALEITGSAVYTTDVNPALLNVNATGIATDGLLPKLPQTLPPPSTECCAFLLTPLHLATALLLPEQEQALPEIFLCNFSFHGSCNKRLSSFQLHRAHTGNGVQVDDATVTGAAVQITASGALTGVGSALSITADSATTAGAVAGEGIVRISADGLTTGQVLDITSTSAVLTSGELANFGHIVSSVLLSDKTGQLFDITSSRTSTRLSLTTADDYDVASIIRTSVQNGAGGTLTSTGSALYIENIATQTAGTLTDSANLVQLVQDSDSSGDALTIDMNAALGAAALTVIDASGARTDALIDIVTTSTGSHLTQPPYSRSTLLERSLPKPMS